MNLLATLRVAARALLRNKLRSFLTALGIIIGVAAVIAMVSIGEGAKARVQEAFASMGTNLLIVLSGSTTSGGARGGFGSQPTLTWDDLKAIQTEVPSVVRAAPQLRSAGPVLSDDQNWTTSITGTTADYFSIRAWRVSSGEDMNDSDNDSRSKRIWLGQTVVDKLYGPNVDPTGLVVRVRNIPFEVAGVLERKGQTSTGQDFDDAVFVPANTFGVLIQGGLKKYLSGAIFVQASDTQRAEEQITALLRDRHRLRAGTDDDFSIRNLAEMASAQEEGTNTMTTLLASVAAVSLFVGGIGIMNIMLVSVTERTREIGTRMAVGARPRDILLQFLIEALVLSLLGGLLGIALGLGVAAQLAGKFGWPLLIRSDIVLVSVLVSAGVGVVFGLYPARKASLLDPIEALRYE
ncbi:MAG TPA: ABC transporter permease [Nevskiaceae bacterium]|nr:ABC transporter permease [Nevskiaceae bacterium]